MRPPPSAPTLQLRPLSVAGRYHVAWLAAALVIALAAAHSGAAPAPDVWKPVAATPGDVNAKLAVIDKSGLSAPLPVRPAVEFQKILVRIASSEPMADCRADLEKFAKATGEDPVVKSLRELALCWEARARMQEIDKALRLFYRKNVRFPDKLDDVRADIPADAKTDPWGDAWVYKSATAKTFAEIAKQRYQLGPTKYPQLLPIADALKAPAPTNWKITPKDVAGAKALEIRTPEGAAAVVQAGGRVGDATLAFLGDGWALFADAQRLFTVSF